MEKRFFRLSAAVILLACGTRASFAIDDYRTRISVLPVENRAGDPAYDTLCSAVGNTVRLVLELMDAYFLVDVIPSLENHGSEGYEPAELSAICSENRLDQVVFGSLVRHERGGFGIAVSLYDAQEGKVTFTKESSVRSALELFDAADTSAVSFIEELHDIHIAFGGLRIVCGGGGRDWTLYLNGRKILNHERLEKKILNGGYDLSITQNRLLGEVEIHRSRIEVFEDKITLVEFDVPPPSMEERTYLETLNDSLAETFMKPAAAVTPDSAEASIRALSRYAAETEGCLYDPALSGMREAALAEATAAAKSQLETLLAEADVRFRSEGADLSELKKTYEAYAGLVNDSYAVSSVSSGTGNPELAFPVRIEAGPGGNLFAVCGFASGTLFSIAPDGTVRAKTGLPVEIVPAETAVSSPDGEFLYLLDPASARVDAYDADLRIVRHFSIPGETSLRSGNWNLAVSTENTVFLYDHPDLFVFAPGGERETEIESRFLEHLGGAADAVVLCAFFDAGGILHVLRKSGRDADGSFSSVICQRFTATGTLLSSASIDVSGRRIDISSGHVDGQGAAYLLVRDLNRVEKYTPDGMLLTTFGTFGSGPGQFQSPSDVAAWGEGNFCIADSYNNRIQIFTPRAQPVLIPEITRFDIRFGTRLDIIRKGEERLKLAKDRIVPGAPLLISAGAAAVTAGAGALLFLSATERRRSDELYARYSAEKDWKNFGGLKAGVETSWFLSKLYTLGAVSCFGVGMMLFSNALFTFMDDSTAAAEILREIRAFEPDYEYVTNDAAFRSLSTARLLGFATGPLPPVLAGASLVALYAFNADQPWITMSLTAAGVGIPPIFSHLYAGSFKPALLISGLAADAFAAYGLYLMQTRPAAFRADPLPWFTDQPFYDGLNQAYVLVQEHLPLILVSSAFCVRFTAGMYDMNRGWVAARNYNLYRAVEKGSPRYELNVKPVVDRYLRPGLAIALSF